MVGLELSFRNSGRDLDHKIWQCVRLWSRGGNVSEVQVWRSRLRPDSAFFRTRCQAKFLSSAKLLPYCCLSVILLLRVKE